MKSELKTNKMTNVKQSHKIICLQVGSDIEIFRMVYTDIQWSKNSSFMNIRFFSYDTQANFDFIPKDEKNRTCSNPNKFTECSK